MRKQCVESPDRVGNAGGMFFAKENAERENVFLGMISEIWRGRKF
jgi:hypothetical protein